MVAMSYVNDFIHEALEIERGGIEIYKLALQCAVSDRLRMDWNESLADTRKHERILCMRARQLGLNPETPSPSRARCAERTAELARSISQAHDNSNRLAAQLVASECVVQLIALQLRTATLTAIYQDELEFAH